eukprot:201054_1
MLFFVLKFYILNKFHIMEFRFEKIGSEITRHELNYINRNREHPIYVTARKFYLNQQWEQAKIEYEKLLSINPNNATYHHSYACILSRYRGANVKQTLKIAQKHSAIAIKLNPSNIHIRLTNLEFLTNLEEHDTLHKEFTLIFKQLLAIPDDIKSRNYKVSLDINSIHKAFEFYSSYLFNICEHQEAINYLETACAIRTHAGKEMQQRLRHMLALYYLRLEKVDKSLHYISIMKQINQKTIWEQFQSDRSNDQQPWTQCEAEIYLLIENYKQAYKLFKCDLALIKKDNRQHSHLLVYTYLITCCIELNKFEEVNALDFELHTIEKKSPALFSLPCNNNVGWARHVLIGYCLIKKGGFKNAILAVEHMELLTEKCLLWNTNLGNRIPNVHFYLGLAYQNLSKYISKENKKCCILKAKFALYQAAHLIPNRTRYMWAFALILCETKELYLCKKYANQSWNKCKDIISVATKYHVLKKKLKKQLKRIQCSWCGGNKYWNSKRQYDKLKVCKGCHVCYYCNRNCQKRHWKELHGKKCCKIWIKWNEKLLKTVEGFNEIISFSTLISDYPTIFEAFKKWNKK